MYPADVIRRKPICQGRKYQLSLPALEFSIIAQFPFCPVETFCASPRLGFPAIVRSGVFTAIVKGRIFPAIVKGKIFLAIVKGKIFPAIVKGKIFPAIVRARKIPAKVRVRIFPARNNNWSNHTELQPYRN